MTQDRLGSIVHNGPDQLRYYPYGEEIGGATAQNRPKFATYNRMDSGIDDAVNRFYNPTWGRFTSPDPAGDRSLGTPASFNRYAYTNGDPMKYNDPSGLQGACPEGSQTCLDVFDTYPYIPVYPLDPNPAIPNGQAPGVNLYAATGSDAADPNFGEKRGEDRKNRDNRTGFLCDDAIIKAMKNAWMKAKNGTAATEAGFFVTNQSGGGYKITELGQTNEQGQISKITLLPGTYALFHTHPSASGGQPSTPATSRDGLGDTYTADISNVDIYVMHATGLSVYKPQNKKTTQLAETLDWMKPCPKP